MRHAGANRKSSIGAPWKLQVLGSKPACGWEFSKLSVLAEAIGYQTLFIAGHGEVVERLSAYDMPEW